MSTFRLGLAFSACIVSIATLSLGAQTVGPFLDSRTPQARAQADSALREARARIVGGWLGEPRAVDCAMPVFTPDPRVALPMAIAVPDPTIKRPMVIMLVPRCPLPRSPTIRVVRDTIR
ncbi:MAG: hypothetical protein M3Z54_03085 [Gemmatimonadota bacterium]|nr:hypothetical protein [Gemmatimonadota bacterium]